MEEARRRRLTRRRVGKRCSIDWRVWGIESDWVLWSGTDPPPYIPDSRERKCRVLIIGLRFSRDAPRPTAPLDAIKFLCKDLWTLLFRKQIDNLKTNHRGIYVLTDNTFKPLTRMSFDTKKFDAAMQAALVQQTGDVALGRDANTQARVQPFLYFPAGVIRGCLASLGITATVTAESAALPGATFQIRTAGAKN